MTLKSKTKKDLRLGYSKRRHLEKGDYGCLTFSFPYIFWQKMTSVRQSRRATDSGFVGLLIWSSKWCRWELDKIHRGLSAFGKRMNEILQCTDPTWRVSQKRLQLVSWKGKSPQIQQCFHHWATDVLVWYVREKRPSTSAFFFFFSSSRQLLRFDFNAFFCVVLYFHAKILLYLNVFILLNVF